MTSTDTTTTAAAPAASTPNIFQEIEAKLEAKGQAAVAWFKNGNANIAALLEKAASGAETFVEEVIGGAGFVAAHATVINSSIVGLSAVAAAVGQSDPSIGTAAQKMLADLQTATNDVAGVSQSLQTGSTAGQPGAVTAVVQAIRSVQTLSQLAGQASGTLSAAVLNTPGATQTATPPSSSTNA